MRNTAARKAVFVDFSRNFWDKHPVYVLTAYLKKHGVEVTYLHERRFGRALERIVHLKPDVVLYSAFNVDLPLYAEFDRLLKQRHPVHSLVGGPGPTYDTSISTRYTFDAVCIGEGECAAVDYLSSGFTGGRNIILRGRVGPPEYAPLCDLDTLPFPDRGGVYASDHLLRSMDTRWFLSGRGCPYSCTYCFNNGFNEMFRGCGPIVRKKSVGYLCAEIQEVRRAYSFRNIVFQDDTFVANRKWLFEFCEEYPRRVGAPFTCNVRASLIDETVVKALKSAGCSGAMFSIESGNDEFRNKILRRHETRAQILETGRLLNKYRIPFRVANIIGLPGETFENMRETIQLNIEVKPTYAHTSIYVPYPFLELTRYALENGHLSQEALAHLPKNLFTTSVLNFTAREKAIISKLMYLFPLMVDFPVLFRRGAVLGGLLRMPAGVLAFLYEMYNLPKQWSIYTRTSSFRSLVLMALRYLGNRQCS